MVRHLVLAVAGDVGDGDAVESIRDGLEGVGGWDGGAVASAVREEYRETLDAQGRFEDGPPLNTPGVPDTVRTSTPRNAVVTTDVGGFRLWSKQVFEAYDPETYVTAGSQGGMGVGLSAAIGVEFAPPGSRPSVSPRTAG